MLGDLPVPAFDIRQRHHLSVIRSRFVFVELPAADVFNHHAILVEKAVIDADVPIYDIDRSIELHRFFGVLRNTYTAIQPAVGIYTRVEIIHPHNSLQCEKRRYAFPSRKNEAAFHRLVIDGKPVPVIRQLHAVPVLLKFRVGDLDDFLHHCLYGGFLRPAFGDCTKTQDKSAVFALYLRWKTAYYIFHEAVESDDLRHFVAVESTDVTQFYNYVRSHYNLGILLVYTDV